MNEPVHDVILDVDTGIDDALALLLAFAHPRINVLAVTCVVGNVALDGVVANTLTVLDVAAAADDVPVAAGASAPLLQPARDASHVHGRDGLAGQRAPSTRAVSTEPALAVLERTLRAATAPVTIVALAPMTNIATLLLAHPDLAGRIERIVFMGGALHTGNATAVAEFNVWHDPEATAIVLRSGVPATMYPLEPFLRLALDPAEVDELASAGPGGALAARLLHSYADDGAGGWRRAISIGDAGAVCVLLDPDAATTITAPVQVSLHPPTRGQTIIDRRDRGSVVLDTLDDAAEIEVVVDIDVRREARLFVETLTGAVGGTMRG